MLDKATVRKQGVAGLDRLAEHKTLKTMKEADLYRQLFASDMWRQARTIGVTLSSPIEVDTEPILQRAFAENKNIAVPKTLPQRQMDFFEITPQTIYEISSFGIREPLTDQVISPDKIDLMLVPGVAFMKTGYRVGFGAGYYDRYLADFPNATCSLIFQEQINEKWKPEPFDIPVAKILIEEVPDE